jgi:protein associated with RNAse G/E
VAVRVVDRLPAMPGDEVFVVYRKYDGALHWHQTMRRLGEDEHGVWLGAEPGITARRGDEPPITVEQAHVMVFPHHGWWTAVFNAPPQRTEIYCDVTTPVTWPSASEVTMVDLDLDVVRRRTGEVEVHDEDEFAEHRVTYGYPDHIVANATAATRWLAAALADGTEPFRSAYRTWLAAVTPDGATPS